MLWLVKNSKKNCLVKIWVTFDNGIISFLSNIFGSGVKRIKVVSGFDVELEVASKNIYPFILFLKLHSLCLFTTMVDIVCYDVPSKTHRFSLVYNLLSLKCNFRLRVTSKVQETFTQVLSLLSLYKSVGWSEREVFDFYGLFFFENTDLRRLLTDYGFKGYPLRKDFPLTGYTDSYYDDNKKKICYKHLELSQEYRRFNFNST
jgi:NADH:ubiquinone oxidoreductase subunit C